LGSPKTFVGLIRSVKKGEKGQARIEVLEGEGVHERGLVRKRQRDEMTTHETKACNNSALSKKGTRELCHLRKGRKEGQVKRGEH